MLKKLLWLFLLVAVNSTLMFAQSGSITGVVTDGTTGEPLPGASVYVQQLDRGSNTDLDGNFTISDVASGTYAVRISFVGFRTQNISVEVADQPVEVNVELQLDLLGLDEVVVTGYGTTPKRELTGSISSVRARDIEDVPLQNAEQLLQGRAAGVIVTSTSGNPGAAFRVNVRGTGSVNAASEPLYIVDGVQISFSQRSNLTNESPLNSINPRDIASIEVIKDAASAAIYGAQAAAGVVIITTKRGQAGATRVSASAETGIREMANFPDYINTQQYLQYLGEARFLNGAASSIEEGRSFYESQLLDLFGSPNPSAPALTNTNWPEFVFSEGVTQKYDVSVSGGSDNTTFRLSAGYENTDGTLKNSVFERLSLQANFDHDITDRLRASLGVNLARRFQFGMCEDGNFINCAPSQAMFEPPFSFPFLDDGSYNPNSAFGTANNPAVIQNEVERKNTVTAIISNLDLRYQATDWLSVSGFAGVDFRNTNDEQFRSVIASPATDGFITFVDRTVENVNTSLHATARQTFGGVHTVSGMAGIEYRREFWENKSTRGDGLPGEFFKVLSATSTPVTAAGSNSEFRRGSYFGRAQYSYDERYIISLIGRYDGHSRFGAETRWGFFPSIAGAWRISQENFFNLGFIDELKLRAGYGINGNAEIGNFAARGLFSAAGSYQGGTALTPSQLENLNLGWEEAREINLGLDFELFEGRITGVIDVFRRDNEELLFPRPLPGDSGFGAIIENIGSVRNQGVEFEISSINIDTRDFMWSTRFNIALMENEILELPDREDVNPTSAFNSLQEGKPIGHIQVPRWAGVNPADGRPLWYDADGNLTYTPVPDRDMVDFKDGFANTLGGFGNTLQYKGLSLDVFFQFSFGQWANASTDFFFTRTPDFLMNLHTMVEDRWRQPGDITYMPRAVEAGTDFPETENFRTIRGTNSVYNASYIRLKDVRLNYNLPTSFSDQLGIRNIRVYAAGINLALWTAWPWYDPEVAFDPRDIFTNVTTASWPSERQVNVGIAIDF